jgi:hypothetical protein
MKKIFIFFILVFSPKVIFAKKSLSAHVHGRVYLDIASDKKELLVILKSSSESLLGFEYNARSQREKAILEKVKKEWSQNLLLYLGANELSDCKISNSKWKQHFESKVHSNIEAEAYIDCNNILAGRTLQIAFLSKYKKINVLYLQLLREDGSILSKKFKNDFKIKI